MPKKHVAVASRSSSQVLVAQLTCQDGCWANNSSSHRCTSQTTSSSGVGFALFYQLQMPVVPVATMAIWWSRCDNAALFLPSVSSQKTRSVADALPILLKNKENRREAYKWAQLNHWYHRWWPVWSDIAIPSYFHKYKVITLILQQIVHLQVSEVIVAPSRRWRRRPSRQLADRCGMPLMWVWKCWRRRPWRWVNKGDSSHKEQICFDSQKPYLWERLLKQG